VSNPAITSHFGRVAQNAQHGTRYQVAQIASLTEFQLLRMNMNSQSLFIELLHRLRKYEDAKYSDAMLLHYLLRQGADETEFKSTAVKVALDALAGCLNRWEVQRAIDRLTQLGLISTRVHANTRTHFKVNRDAVLALLAKPLPRNLPGIDERHFSFLDEWQAAQSEPGSEEATGEPDTREAVPR
jgi:hypothetical protein